MAKYAGRCECYKDHNSRVGRCNVRNVTDPTVAEDDHRTPVLCDRCRTECKSISIDEAHASLPSVSLDDWHAAHSKGSK